MGPSSPRGGDRPQLMCSEVMSASQEVIMDWSKRARHTEKKVIKLGHCLFTLLFPLLTGRFGLPVFKGWI